MVLFKFLSLNETYQLHGFRYTLIQICRWLGTSAWTLLKCFLLILRKSIQFNLIFRRIRWWIRRMSLIKMYKKSPSRSFLPFYIRWISFFKLIMYCTRGIRILFICWISNCFICEKLCILIRSMSFILHGVRWLFLYFTNACSLIIEYLHLFI